MEKKFTPGPWVAEDFMVASEKIPNDGGDIICEIPKGKIDSMRRWPANAALIAAAPDLLEALEEVVKMQEDNYGDGIATHLKLAALHPKLLTAITKATTINQP